MKNKFTLFLLLLTVILAAAPQGVYDWSKSRKLHDSIQHAFIYAKEPRLMKINAVRIDLNDKSLKLFAAPRDKDYGKPMPDYPSMKIETKRP